MPENTETLLGEQPESSVIQELREQIKELNKQVKTVADDTRTKITRESQAKSLMPEGYEGLASYYEQEVDGDLSAETVKDWLVAKGINASPESEGGEVETGSPAEQLEAVTDLGAAVASAANQNAASDLQTKMDKIMEEHKGAGSLPDVTAALAAALGQ